MPYEALPVSQWLTIAATNRRFLEEQQFVPRRASSVFLMGYEEVPRKRMESPNLVASFVLGLTSDVKFGPVEEYDEKEVRAEVMKVFPWGGSIIIQLGWWVGRTETSVRVLVENDQKYSNCPDEEFVRLVKSMVGSFIDRYKQQVIWLDFYRGNEQLDAVEFHWKP